MLISTAVAIGIITILAFFIVWICFPANNPQDSFKDALGFASGLFGGLTTFGSAIIATKLFNDWRVEKNYDLENQYLSNIVIGLRDIHAELLEMQDSSKQIKEVPSKIISYASHLNRSRFEIKPALNKLDADVLIYSRLLNDKDLLDLLKNLKGYCYSFENQYNQLIHKYYRDYLNKLNDYFSSTQIVNIDYKDKTSYERAYLEDERRFLSSEIKEIEIFFYLHKSCNANGKKISIDFLELADCSLGAINNFQDACIKKLRPKNET